MFCQPSHPTSWLFALIGFYLLGGNSKKAPSFLALLQARHGTSATSSLEDNGLNLF